MSSMPRCNPRVKQNRGLSTQYHSRLAGLSCLLLFLLVACTATQAQEPRPPEIAYGLDSCDSCGMLISEPRFAAATLLVGGQSRKFDDIGDMLVYHMDHPDQPVGAWFVHDYHDETWLRAESAYFVMDGRIQSPMSHGVVAFAEEVAATRLAADLAANVLTFDQVRAAVHVAAHSHSPNLLARR